VVSTSTVLWTVHPTSTNNYRKIIEDLLGGSGDGWISSELENNCIAWQLWISWETIFGCRVLDLVHQTAYVRGGTGRCVSAAALFVINGRKMQCLVDDSFK